MTFQLIPSGGSSGTRSFMRIVSNFNEIASLFERTFHMTKGNRHHSVSYFFFCRMTLCRSCVTALFLISQRHFMYTLMYKFFFFLTKKVKIIISFFLNKKSYMSCWLFLFNLHRLVMNLKLSYFKTVSLFLFFLCKDLHLVIRDLAI